MSSGYTQCTCRDCFDDTVSSDTTNPELCSDCEDAGCTPECEIWGLTQECQRLDIHGADDDVDG